MFLLESIILIIIGLVSPIMAITVGTVIILSRKKINYLSILIVSLLIGYIGSFYLYNSTDDMARYVIYMGRISIYNDVIDYLKAVYSDGGISTYGVNAANWPLSGIVLFLTQKYGNYRFLSGFSLAFISFVRYVLVFKIVQFNESKSYKKIFFTRLLFLFALFITAYPVRVVSGFRWWLSMTISLYAIYSDFMENKDSINNSKLISIKTIIFFIIAGLLHPSAYIYLLLRIAAGYITMKTSAVKKIGLVLFLLIGFFVIFFSGKLNSLVNQFMAYTNFELSAYSFLFNLSVVTVSTFSLVYLIRQKNSFPRVELVYAFLIQITTFILFPLRVFDRMYQFSVPAMILFLLLSCGRRDGKLTNGILISLVGFIAIYLTIYIAQPTLALPQLSEDALRVFFTPIHLK